MRPLLTSLLLSLLLPSGIACAAESLFTKLDLDRCKTLDAQDGGVVLSCAGLKNNPVTYKEGDLRASIFYGPLNESYRNEAFETFSSFNTVNTTVEWRLEDKRPIAAILRFFISNPNPETGEPDEKRKGQVLVITKVAGPKTGRSCVVGMVDALAEPDANEKAHEVADMVAPIFLCGINQPRYFGARGDTAPDLTSTLPAKTK